MELSDILNGFFCLIFVIVSITLGLIIASKYFKYKQKTFLYFGFTWIGLASLWMAKSISVIYTLITLNDFDTAVFMFIGNVFLPISSFAWLVVFTELAFKKNKKIVLLCFGIYSLLMEAFILYFIITDPNQIGTFIPPIDVNNSLMFSIYYGSLVVIILITGIIFGIKSLKSEYSEIKLKGKLIIVGASLFFLGGVFEIISTIHIVIMIIGKIFLVMCAIFYYAGWLLPEWAKRLLLKEK